MTSVCRRPYVAFVGPAINPSGAGGNWLSDLIAGIAALGAQAVHRKAQDATRQRLYSLRASGGIDGFLLPHLGQLDRQPKRAPTDLVPREVVFGYPANFAPMSADDLPRLTTRGEQVTSALIDEHRWSASGRDPAPGPPVGDRPRS